MNKRQLACGKHKILAIGQENSANDLKNKIDVCFKCYDFLFCSHAVNYLESLKKQCLSVQELSTIYNKDKI